MNENNIKNEEIDGLLTTFFKAQLPNPWPSWQAPPAANGSLRRRSSWLSYTRLAVAASVGVMLAAYLALAGFFPREVIGRMNQDPTRHIGKDVRLPIVQPK